MNKNKRNFWIDLSLLALLGLTTLSGLVVHTGGSHAMPSTQAMLPLAQMLHKVLGGVMVMIFVPHIRFHKDWIKAVAFNPAKPKSGRVRTNLLINGLLFCLVVAIVVTGLVPAPHPHMALGIVFVLTVGVHQLLHYKWIAHNTQRYLFRAESKPRKPASSSSYSPTP
jgi:hypothetical protein